MMRVGLLCCLIVALASPAFAEESAMYEAKIAGACRIARTLGSNPHVGAYIAAACKDEASIHKLSLDTWSLAWLNRITIVARGQQ